MGNSLRKKRMAAMHNMSRDLLSKMIPVGSCQCGGSLYIYLESAPENMYNVYCTHNDCGVSDIRSPHPGDVYYKGVQAVVDFIKRSYGEDEVAKTWEKPPSALVDNVKAASEGVDTNASSA
jgi:hypothetical protein